MENELCFINPTKCDMFSYLRGIDLQELIVQIENFYLVYRNILNLPSDVTFGTEIEYEGLKKEIADDYIRKNFFRWTSKSDCSCESGGEISSPILQDNTENWRELKKICEFLKENKVITNQSAGGHIHIGAHVLGTDVKKWIPFLKVYTAYENVIFRFSHGDKISGRKKILKYASPIADELFEKLQKINKTNDISTIAYQVLLFQRNQALNFNNVQFSDISNGVKKNTLEFRCPNATIEEVVWQNNINTFTKLILCANSSHFDEEFLDFKLENERISSEKEYYLYSEVFLKDALEFVDLVFDNNLDKVYFLRQYIKGFQTSYGTAAAQKSKSLFCQTKCI